MTSPWPLLDQLIIYRNLITDDFVRILRSDCTHAEKSAKAIKWAEELSLTGNINIEYLLHRIAEDENPFSVMSERTAGQIGPSLKKALIQDMHILRQLFRQLLQQNLSDPIFSHYTPTVEKKRVHIDTLRHLLVNDTQVSDDEKIVDGLINHYVLHGYGDMARYKVFRWSQDSGLIPVNHPDTIQLDDLVGYERQKSVLIQNTEAFIQGRPANNVLLVGSRGTGKSSSVKAILNQYSPCGLRLVEITKHDLRYLSIIMQVLRERGNKFILFMDDLSFEEFEIEYRHLKSMMEGGVESKPDNVLIYATSNRRHLIKETWSDRSGANADDIHSWDTVNEKISLSDRFGITLTFAPPNQDEYLRIVETMARKRNLAISASDLRAEAIKWETAHSGRSGRIAQQFIAHIEGREIA